MSSNKLSKKLRWGVLSTANIGRAAVNPAIQASHNGELLAVASRAAHKAHEFAKEHGIPKHFGGYMALLEDTDIDAVYIPLPNSMHREWTIKAAEKGKHILCEKPLGLNAAECEDMLAAARANNVRLMEAFMYRFHPQTEKVLELVRSGALGELRLVHSSFSFRLPQAYNIRLDAELGGGALMDVGCYCLNISRTVVGSEPVEAWAFAHRAESGVDDELTSMLRFENGVMAQFDCAFTMTRRQEYEVVGTDASLKVPVAFVPGTEDTVLYERRGRNEAVRHSIPGTDEYRLMVEHFTDCVLHNRPLRYPAEDAIANMHAIDALYRSAMNGGKPEKL